MPLDTAFPHPGRLRQIDAAARALHASRAWTSYSPESLAQAAWRAAQLGPAPLSGLAVSVKDLIDAQGWPTSSGSSTPRQDLPVASHDSHFVALWRRAGAWIVGKTHLNEHAYGLTGENPWWGDCTLPGDPSRLTGGSSSGAAASVLGGAADVGLGTDTGGSLRVPASLCGLASLRAPGWFPSHVGVQPLAPTFDALGWISRDVESLALAATPWMPSHASAQPPEGLQLAVLDGPLLEPCDADVRKAWARLPEAIPASLAGVLRDECPGLSDATARFAPLQALEAWRVHAATLESRPDAFGPAVRQRLEWGRSLARDEPRLRADALAFRSRMRAGLGPMRILAMPACAVSRLRTGDDHAPVRARILALTTPASLGGLPVLTQPLPWAEPSRPVGVQWIASPGGEALLVRWASWLARSWDASRSGQHGQNATSAMANPADASRAPGPSWIP